MMLNEEIMDINYEKLRKKLVRREFLSELLGGSHANPNGCVNAESATPEELLKIARRYHINLDKYKNKSELE